MTHNSGYTYRQLEKAILEAGGRVGNQVTWPPGQEYGPEEIGNMFDVPWDTREQLATPANMLTDWRSKPYLEYF